MDMEGLGNGKTYALEETVLALLPAFVAAKAKEVARKRGLVRLTFHDLSGCMDSEDSGKRIEFWVPGARQGRHWMYLGGSNCWIVPSSLTVNFESIPDELLCKVHDLKLWWVLSSDHYDAHERSLHVYRITVVAEDKVVDEWDVL
jgi:hypothetical protein